MSRLAKENLHEIPIRSNRVSIRIKLDDELRTVESFGGYLPEDIGW